MAVVVAVGLLSAAATCSDLDQVWVEIVSQTGTRQGSYFWTKRASDRGPHE